jgi:urease accessory protein
MVSSGIMAGDRQEINLNFGEGTGVVWTSQSYEKIHRMEAGAWAERNCTITVAANAFLHYRPLPVIPFGGSDFRGAVRINLAGDTSRLIYADILCAGRVARGELFQFRRCRQLVEIRRAGQLIYRDNTDLRPAETGSLNLLGGIGFFEGFTHTASLALCNTGDTLAQIRERLAALTRGTGIAAAATTLWGGALLVRALGHSAEELEILLEGIAAGSFAGSSGKE